MSEVIQGRGRGEAGKTHEHEKLPAKAVGKASGGDLGQELGQRVDGNNHADKRAARSQRGRVKGKTGQNEPIAQIKEKGQSKDYGDFSVEQGLSGLLHNGKLLTA